MSAFDLPVKPFQNPAVSVAWYVVDQKGEYILIGTEKIVKAVCQMLNSRRDLINGCMSAKEWIDKFGEHAPITFGGEADLSNQLADAIHRADLPWDEWIKLFTEETEIKE